MMEFKFVTPEDDLERVVDEINQSSWDDTNDMAAYDVESLAAYLDRQDVLFLTCHDVSVKKPKLMGIASSRIEIKPYGKELWLYVDEVDVCADQRQKGAGAAMMQTLIETAQERGCEEIWLATELENTAANALYRSLEPDDVAQVIGYTYETFETDE